MTKFEGSPPLGWEDVQIRDRSVQKGVGWQEADWLPGLTFRFLGFKPGSRDPLRSTSGLAIFTGQTPDGVCASCLPHAVEPLLEMLEILSASVASAFEYAVSDMPAPPLLGVAACNHKRSDLQSRHFSTRIICNYRQA